MENIINPIVSFYQSIPESTWALIAASGVVSIVLQFLKKKLSLQSDKVIASLLTGLSFITVAINYLMVSASQNPTVLGQQTATVVGAATLLYRFLIKPASALVIDARTLRQQNATPDSIKSALTTPAPGVAQATQSLIGDDIAYESTASEPKPSAPSNEASF